MIRSDSYYGRPVIKPPVWRPEIPWYFFAGGLGGTSCALAFAAGAARNRPLARRSWLIALAGLGVSPLLLIRDLGRPERFFNMLRVFKPTSPMNLGAWLLVMTTGSAGVAAANEYLGVFPRLAPLSRASAAACGLPLSTYTAVLVANSAVPVWQEGRRELPFVFAGSAAASAGGAALVVTPSRHAGPARRLVLAGVLLEEGATLAMEHTLGELAATYHEGEAGRYTRLARMLTAAGAAIVGLRGRRRSAAVSGGALMIAGSILKRWAVFRAGFQSASDPRQTVGPQRQRREERAPAK